MQKDNAEKHASGMKEIILRNDCDANKKAWS
jgi:hypothetical protein